MHLCHIIIEYSRLSWSDLTKRLLKLGTLQINIEADNIKGMKEYKFTAYFENEVLRKRPYIRKEWCIRAVESAVRIEKQEENRYRFWAPIEELQGRYLRVITLEDKTTIHNAFPDRGFQP